MHDHKDFNHRDELHQKHLQCLVARLGPQSRSTGRVGKSHALIGQSGCYGNHRSACSECRGHNGHTSVLLNNNAAGHTTSTKNTLHYKLPHPSSKDLPTFNGQVQSMVGQGCYVRRDRTQGE